jgi:hypothetical protein
MLSEGRIISQEIGGELLPVEVRYRHSQPVAVALTVYGAVDRIQDVLRVYAAGCNQGADLQSFLLIRNCLCESSVVLFESCHIGKFELYAAKSRFESLARGVSS